jgi:hypothetical protein
MTKDTQNKFKDLDEATEYFKEIYKVLPESVIKDVIEFCIKNPDRFPEGHEKIDISKPPLPKKEIEKEIIGAVEIYDDPNDPNLSVIKHKDGASLLSREEADELQAKIDKALAEQKEDDLRQYQEKYEKHNKAILKAKLKEAKSRVARK